MKNTLIPFAAFLSLVMLSSAHGATLLECHLREGKFSERREIAAWIVESEDQATLYTDLITNLPLVKKSNGRTGSFKTYRRVTDSQDELELTLESSGEIRRAYYSEMSEDLSVHSILALKCHESKE